MRIRLFSVIAALALLAQATYAGPPAADVAQDHFYKQLDAYAAHDKPVMFIAGRIEERLAKEPGKLPVALAWARAQAEAKAKDAARFNSLYYMILSDMNRRSMHTVKKNSPHYKVFAAGALQALYALELMLTQDFARCRNPIDTSTAGLVIAPRYAKLSYLYPLFNQKEMTVMWASAVKIETARASRLPNAEVCSGGVNTGVALLEGAPAEMIPDSVQPAYIEDAAWNAEREKIRARLKGYWQSRYQGGQ